MCENCGSSVRPKVQKWLAYIRVVGNCNQIPNLTYVTVSAHDQRLILSVAFSLLIALDKN